MGSVMGQFPLRNGVFFSGCYKVKSVGQWGKNSGNGNGVCRSLEAVPPLRSSLLKVILQGSSLIIPKQAVDFEPHCMYTLL